MTTLSITADLAKKRLKVEGRVAAGEKVAVTVKGFGDKSVSNTRLRVMFAEKVVAIFPLPNAETGWTKDGEDLTGVLNLNTVQAERITQCGSIGCFWVLDDVSDEVRQLYGTAEHELLKWVKCPDTDVPVDLDSFPTLIEEMQQAIATFKSEIRGEWTNYQQTLSAAWTQYRDSLAELYSQFTNNVSSLVNGKASAQDLNAHTGNKSNPHEVTKAQVGLENVDNTADVDKPVSTQQQTAINSAKEQVANLVQSEARRAAGKEQELQNGIDAEGRRASSAESDLDLAIRTEKSRAEGAESALGLAKQDKLSSQQLAAVNSGIDASKVAKIAQNESAILAEVSRATTEEARLQALINAIKTFEVVVADSLPSPSSQYSKKLYLIPSTNPETRNVRDEFICVLFGGTWKWEQIGSTAIILEFDTQPTDGSSKLVRSGGIFSWVSTKINQVIAYATDTFSAKSHTHTKSSITDFPETMPPEGHVETHRYGGTDEISPQSIKALATQGVDTQTIYGNVIRISGTSDGEQTILDVFCSYGGGHIKIISSPNNSTSPRILIEKTDSTGGTYSKFLSIEADGDPETNETLPQMIDRHADEKIGGLSQNFLSSHGSTATRQAGNRNGVAYTFQGGDNDSTMYPGQGGEGAKLELGGGGTGTSGRGGHGATLELGGGGNGRDDWGGDLENGGNGSKLILRGGGHGTGSDGNRAKIEIESTGTDRTKLIIEHTGTADETLTERIRRDAKDEREMLIFDELARMDAFTSTSTESDAFDVAITKLSELLGEDVSELAA